ncbi:ArsR/SmtB family transcription factor [Carboxylicivirga marina]|uniref:Helix-turn-helix transcriptional regulator n=1 Tax=Carboxylicivirga marina TaxID=2800988 RepID=A0ABS1HEE4_9BACT|nr:helix-turn-helix transcriptional regulator [Carboxylicivirga marina]MBK3516039.1 helix-turn-helix transcriptional regulator [Carboxylicivirga marina]
MPQAKTDLFDNDLQELALIFKALGHPARLQILKFLGNRDACFSGDITEIVPLGRTTVNQHIAELKKAGLIKGTIQGSKTNYCLNPCGIEKLTKLGIDFCTELENINNFQSKEC